MTTMADSLLDTIHFEFDLACQDMAQAKLAQRTKDTVAARARVEACRERVDALLDMWNAAGGSGPDRSARGSRDEGTPRSA